MAINDCVNEVFEKYKANDFVELKEVVPNRSRLEAIAVPYGENGNDTYILLRNVEFGTNTGRGGEVFVYGIPQYFFHHKKEDSGILKSISKGFARMRGIKEEEPVSDYYYKPASQQNRRKIPLSRNSKVIPYYRTT